MAFKSLFEVKKTGTIFNLANISGSFVEKGVYNSSTEGGVDMELLIKSLITAAHFIPKKEGSNLNPLLGNPVSNIEIKEKGIIEDFHYKDFIQNNIPLDTSHFSNQDRSSTYVSPQILSGPAYNKPTFDVIMSRRIQGDISVFPTNYISVDLKNEFVKYKMYFFYTQEGKAESGGDLKVVRDLGNIKLLSDSPDSNDKSNVVAVLMTTENFFGFINLMADLNTKSESEAEEFRVEYRMSISKSLKAIYLNKQLNSDSVDIHNLETFYNIIPYGCLGTFEISLLTRDLFKLLVHDALSLFYDTSSAMLKIITGFNDLQLLYKYLTVHPNVIIQYYNFISGNDKRNEFCSFFTGLSYVYQPVEDPLELPLILMGGDFNVTVSEKNGFLEIHNFTTETSYKQTGISQANLGKEGDPVYVATSKDTTHLKATFHPLDLVILQNATTGEVTIVCALHVKRLVDEKNWANMLNLVFFVVDVLSIFFAVGLLAKGVVGILRVFAIADIVISSVNIAIETPALRAYLNKTESGKWFLDNWNNIALVSAIGIMSVSFARQVVDKGAKVLLVLEDARNTLKNVDNINAYIDDMVNAIIQVKRTAEEIIASGLVKRVKGFVLKWNGKSMIRITAKELADNIRGFTTEANEIADLIINKKLKVIIMSDSSFDDYLKRNFSKLGQDFVLKKGDFIPAVNVGDLNIFRASTPPEQILSNLVHEGTHALDNIKIEELSKLKKSEDEIKAVFGDRHAFELRAYTNQFNFEIAIGLSSRFKNIDEITKYVASKYPKDFN